MLNRDPVKEMTDKKQISENQQRIGENKVNIILDNLFLHQNGKRMYSIFFHGGHIYFHKD